MSYLKQEGGDQTLAVEVSGPQLVLIVYSDNGDELARFPAVGADLFGLHVSVNSAMLAAGMDSITGKVGGKKPRPNKVHDPKQM